jgi:hypothetical protein
MVAAFVVTTQSLQKVSQMEHKDMLHATYRLKIAIHYRSKRHLSLKDKCSYELGMLMKRSNRSKVRWDL